MLVAVREIKAEIKHGDCVNVLADYPDNTVVYMGENCPKTVAIILKCVVSVFGNSSPEAKHFIPT